MTANGPQSEGIPQIPDLEFLGLVGRGSYGEVWLARTVTEQIRAVKIVRKGRFADPVSFEQEFLGVQSFERVARTHPHLVDVLHVGRGSDGDSFYYVMGAADDVRRGQQITPGDYVPDTLRARLNRHEPLSIKSCIEVGIALADGLSHLHAGGLVHRDIKPSNIVFIGGKPRLADIGLVREVSEDRSLAGTEGYVAPEGAGAPKADLYSLGMVLYVGVTGLEPPDFPSIPNRIATWTSTERKMFLEFNEVLLRACARDEKDRYTTATEFKKELSLILHGASLRRRRKLRRAAVAAAIVVVAALMTELWHYRAVAAIAAKLQAEEAAWGYRLEGDSVVFTFEPSRYDVVDVQAEPWKLGTIRDLPPIKRVTVVGTFNGWRDSDEWLLHRVRDGVYELHVPASKLPDAISPHRFKFLVNSFYWVGATDAARNRIPSLASDTFDLLLDLPESFLSRQAPVPEATNLPSGFNIVGSNVVFEFDPSRYRVARRDIDNVPHFTRMDSLRILEVALVAPFTGWHDHPMPMQGGTDHVYRLRFPLPDSRITNGMPFDFLINEASWAYLPERPGPPELNAGKACHTLYGLPEVARTQP